MIPQFINAVFMHDFNASGGDRARDATIRYVYEKTRSLPHPPEGLAVGLHKIANRIRLSINATVDGESVEGIKEWTEDELLTSKRPITELFDEVIDSVFEVPSEGTSVS